ncbi:MAG: TlpA disulfide reductase family protein [Gemmatimonadales bacterium]
MGIRHRATHGWANHRWAIVGLFLLGAAFPRTALTQTRIGIERGATPAPLTLEAIDGGSVNLANSFGKRPVVLEFWATWCPKCKALEPQMAEAKKRFGDRVDFYGIAVAVGQDPKRVREHLAMHPLPYPMLWDADGEATRRFMAPTTSYIVILDAAGKVAYTGVDTEQDVLGALARVLEEPS